MAGRTATVSITRRSFLMGVAGASVLAFAGAGALAGCSSAGGATTASGTSTEGASTMGATQITNTDKALVAFFSHTGENYGVGTITTGNTAIIAGLIADKVGADSFEITTQETYPQGYDDCCDVAKDELSANARPELATAAPSLDGYDTIFVGYPIWWGDAPMAVYTFIEACTWSGKNVVPFCTHAGSGLGDTPSLIASAASGSQVVQGLAVTGVTAQTDRASAEQSVSSWLSDLGIA